MAAVGAHVLVMDQYRRSVCNLVNVTSLQWSFVLPGGCDAGGGVVCEAISPVLALTVRYCVPIGRRQKGICHVTISRRPGM